MAAIRQLLSAIPIGVAGAASHWYSSNIARHGAVTSNLPS
jgi:hypothetical protein